MLQVSEIFNSVSGEIGGLRQGSPCTFLRLFGCNQHCNYCDTEYALTVGEKKTFQNMSEKNVFEEIKALSSSYDCLPGVVITGGEPLLQQKGLADLFNLFSSTLIQIETNGTIVPQEILFRRSSIHRAWVVDYKTAGSGIQASRVDVLATLMDVVSAIVSYGRDDSLWVKFVLTDISEWEDIVHVMRILVTCFPEYVMFGLSATSAEILRAIVGKLNDRSNIPMKLFSRCSLSVQIHKYIGLVENGRGK